MNNSVTVRNEVFLSVMLISMRQCPVAWLAMHLICFKGRVCVQGGGGELLCKYFGSLQLGISWDTKMVCLHSLI